MDEPRLNAQAGYHERFDLRSGAAGATNCDCALHMRYPSRKAGIARRAAHRQRSKRFALPQRTGKRRRPSRFALAGMPFRPHHGGAVATPAST